MQLYSTEEIAKALKCHPSTVQRAAKKLTPAPKRIGGQKAFAFTSRDFRKLAAKIAANKPGNLNHKTAVANGSKGGRPKKQKPAAA